ncbi:inhibin alpha chain-like [Amphiprion ocellaris]|uniref:Inhibin alpha chain n=1 Tax=Amphiprion ocellaris TaxID=80972 RepID=A0AAQ5XKT3_AMPOC|nr:inhibin alpha chain [Amphiprion ocellaris]XP_054864144.1 inhibin alpha chain-like [Amphiprion ocellaris]
MVSCAVFLFWIHVLTEGSRGEELPREDVLAWFRQRVLDGLGLEGPPLPGPDGDVAPAGSRHLHQRAPRMSRTTWVSHETRPDQEASQMILFPGSDSSCATSSPGETTNTHFTYHFQPSIDIHATVATSAHLWFHAGEASTANSSSPLFMLTSSQQLLQAAAAPSAISPDGWFTYQLDRSLLTPVAEGPFLLQVHCAACRCQDDQPDKTPFLHIHIRPRGPVRSPRRAAATIPWSPSAVYLLQRPSQERPEHSDCQRAQIEISFEELGWDSWIVHPKVLTFYYCHGNCSAEGRTTAMLGISQCCAPVPGTMKSLKITTTSDGGYSFKYETLPNIIPEECTCI